MIQYNLKTVPGIPISRYRAKAPDLARALSSPTGKVTIVAPIPGTDMIGIAVPVPKSTQFKKKKSYQVLTITKTMKVTKYSMAELLRDATTGLLRAISKYSGIIAERVNQIGRKGQDDTNLS